MGYAVLALAFAAAAIAIVLPLVVFRLQPAPRVRLSPLPEPQVDLEQSRRIEALLSQLEAEYLPQPSGIDETSPTCRKLSGIVRSELRWASTYGVWAGITGSEALRKAFLEARDAEYGNALRAASRLHALGFLPGSFEKTAPDPEACRPDLSDAQLFGIWSAELDAKMPDVMGRLKTELAEGKFDPVTADVLRIHYDREHQTHAALKVAFERALAT